MKMVLKTVKGLIMVTMAMAMTMAMATTMRRERRFRGSSVGDSRMSVQRP